MPGKTGRRILVLDTSVFIHDPDCIEAFPDDLLIISPWVIEGLDNLKLTHGERGEHARQASLNIYHYCLKGDIRKGVTTKNGGMVQTEIDSAFTAEAGYDSDNKILSLAKHLSKCTNQPVVIVSTNVNLHIKARMLGISSVNYDGGDHVRDPYAIFPGYFHIPLKHRAPLIEIHKQHWVDLQSIIDASDKPLDDLLANHCVCFHFEDDGGTFAIYKKGEGFRLVPKKQNGQSGKTEKKVNPRNGEQAFAYSLLMDPDVQLVVLMGTEGSGKTLMSLLAGYRQLRSEFEEDIDPEEGPLYKKMMIFRPTVEKGQPLGFLPGMLDEKFEPWMYPVFDNMLLFLPNLNAKAKGTNEYSSIFDLMERGVLEISPVNYIRGRSLRNAFIIVDEAQNLKQDDLKMLITRAAEGSKVVLTGGVSQIDHPYMDKYSNGLSRVVSVFMGQEIFGYTIMRESGQRSMLTKLAAELL